MDDREKRILMAVKAVNDGELKFSDAAKMFEIPKSTLHDHVSLNCRKFTKGRTCIFSTEEERKFVQLFKDLVKSGYHLQPDDCRRGAFIYAELAGHKHNFNREEKMAGRKWFEGFMKRNGIVVTKRTNELTPKSERRKKTSVICANSYNFALIPN